MEGNRLEHELVAVLFPGIVKNEEKALACLGGIRNISNVYSHSSKQRLALSYQPDNPFVKKIYASPKPAAGVLLKVRVKKIKEGNEIKREVLSTTIVGGVNTMYRFESMCDFQYMPIHRETQDAPFKCIREEIIPSGTETLDYITKPSPLFLPPGIFTRFEKPIWYSYTDKKYLERSNTEENESVHNKLRSLRGSQVAPYVFNLTDDLPTEPAESFIKQRLLKQEYTPCVADDYETVKKMFEERPIWSLNLVRYHTKIRLIYLKVIMPCVAIYMKKGPWRTMWVKYGYDPRKEPGARIYQTLDFRLRYNEGLRSKITDVASSSAHDTSGVQSDRPSKRKHTNEPPSSDEIAESSVYFRTDTVPTQRHIFYQYCDVRLPEVEEILSAAPPGGYLCHPTRGWLPPNTDEVCRDHMSRYVKQNLLASNNPFIKFDEGDGGSDDDSMSEDEAAPNDIDNV